MPVTTPLPITNAHVVLLAHSKQPDAVVQPLFRRLAWHRADERLWLAVVSHRGHGRPSQNLFHQGVRAVQRGADGLLIVPLFEPAGHVRHSIALHIMQLKHRYAGLATAVLPPISEHRLNAITVDKVVKKALTGPEGLISTL